MKPIIEKHKQFMKTKPLDSRVFMIVLVVGIITTILSVINTVIEGLGAGAVLSTLACLIVLLALMVVAFVFEISITVIVWLCWFLSSFSCGLISNIWFKLGDD